MSKEKTPIEELIERIKEEKAEGILFDLQMLDELQEKEIRFIQAKVLELEQKVSKWYYKAKELEAERKDLYTEEEVNTKVCKKYLIMKRIICKWFHRKYWKHCYDRKHTWLCLKCNERHIH